MHSTARLFGDSTKIWVGGFYLMAWLLLAAAGWLAGLGFVFYIGVAAAGAHLAWQVYRLDINDGANCLRLFKSNRDLGLFMFLAIVGGIASL